MAAVSEEQRAKIALRLAQPKRGSEDGSAPQELAAAISATDPQQAVAHALLHNRVLVPLVIGADCADGQMAIFTQGSATGLDCFAANDALLAAYPRARPQVTSGVDAARKALTAGGALRLDGIVLPGVACMAIAVGDEWLAAWNDAEFAAEIAEMLADLGLGLDGIKPDTDGSVVVSIAVRIDQRLAVVQAIDMLNAMESVVARCGKVRVTLVAATA